MAQNTEQGTSDSEAEDEKLEELETMLKEHDPEFQKWVDIKPMSCHFCVCVCVCMLKRFKVTFMVLPGHSFCEQWVK